MRTTAPAVSESAEALDDGAFVVVAGVALGDGVVDVLLLLVAAGAVDVLLLNAVDGAFVVADGVAEVELLPTVELLPMPGAGVASWESWESSSP